MIVTNNGDEGVLTTDERRGGDGRGDRRGGARRPAGRGLLLKMEALASCRF